MIVRRHLGILCAVASLLIAHLGQAQITVQESDVQKIFGVHGTIMLYHDTSTMVSVGLTGGPNVYDFSSLAFPDSMTNTIFTASDIPFLAARFDPASMVWGSSKQMIGGNSVFLLTQNSLSNLGKLTLFDSLQEVQHSFPPEETLEFPASYLSTWSTSGPGGGVDSTFINNALTNVTTGWNSAGSYVVDGYGTLIFKGHSHQCLRVKYVEASTYTAKDFNFFTRDGLVIVVESTKDQNDTGKVKIRDVNCISSSSVTSVLHADLKPASYSLLQNFPNPFNPSTTISFSLPQESVVRLTIIDLLGREVARLVDNEVRTPGTYNIIWNASALASGVYLYRLQSGNFVETRKLVLLK